MEQINGSMRKSESEETVRWEKTAGTKEKKGKPLVNSVKSCNFAPLFYGTAETDVSGKV